MTKETINRIKLDAENNKIIFTTLSVTTAPNSI
jgi:hypothetical protein